MFTALSGWFIARLKYSTRMGQPFYSTTLRVYEDANSHGQQRVLAPAQSQDTDAPQCQVYFGKGIGDFQKSDDYAFVNCNQNATGNLIMTEAQMKTSVAKLEKATAQEDKTTQASK